MPRTFNQPSGKPSHFKSAKPERPSLYQCINRCLSSLVVLCTYFYLLTYTYVKLFLKNVLTDRFIRWEMDIVGLPVVQAATQGFESGLAEALSSETGDYTNENSTVVVREHNSCENVSCTRILCTVLCSCDSRTGRTLLFHLLLSSYPHKINVSFTPSLCVSSTSSVFRTSPARHLYLSSKSVKGSERRNSS